MSPHKSQKSDNRCQGQCEVSLVIADDDPIPWRARAYKTTLSHCLLASKMSWDLLTLSDVFLKNY